MKKIYLISTALALAGCGTVFSGTSQDISFDSNVKEVSVYIDGAFACKTPCVYPAERASGSISIVGKKEGYEDVGMALKTQINPAAIGNITFIYSWTTDLVDGAAWKYRQDGVYLNMEKKKMTRAEKEDFHHSSQIKRFVLFNYPELQNEAFTDNFSGPYMQSLSELSGKSPQKIAEQIKFSKNEVHCAEMIVK
ncbi:MAG: PEGA domain-containing protein [Alphaproteobacteria bacterium]|nr:PEGA domain-containing protein [Alphaproteobacteria bacterium]